MTCLSSSIIAQDFCAIKLVDSYSYDQIEVTKIEFVSQKKYHVDKTNNLLILDKPRGKKISIGAVNYETKDSEVFFKRHYGDTIVIELEPVDSIIQLKFKDLYYSPAPNDTIVFESLSQVDTKLKVYLNYLSALNGQCDNGTCNYSNTYSYMIEFTSSEGIFRLDSIIKLQPKEYQCDPLVDALNRLKYIFPKFQLGGENNKIRKRFTIILN